MWSDDIHLNDIAAEDREGDVFVAPISGGVSLFLPADDPEVREIVALFFNQNVVAGEWRIVAPDRDIPPGLLAAGAGEMTRLALASGRSIRIVIAPRGDRRTSHTAYPISTPWLYELIPGVRIDALVHATRNHPAPRFLPVRVILPSESGFARTDQILLRTRRGHQETFHCLDMTLSGIVAEAPADSLEGRRMRAAFEALYADVDIAPIGESASGLPLFRPQRPHPRVHVAERRLDIFEDIPVRIHLGTPAPGAKELASIGCQPGDPPAPTLYVYLQRSLLADLQETLQAAIMAIAYLAAAEAGGGIKRRSFALELVEALVAGRGARSFAALVSHLRIAFDPGDPDPEGADI